jgi:hypothetical protein
MPRCWLRDLILTRRFLLFVLSRLAEAVLERRGASQANNLFSAAGAEQSCGQGMERLLPAGNCRMLPKRGACIHSTGTIADSSAALQVLRRGREAARKRLPACKTPRKNRLPIELTRSLKN